MERLAPLTRAWPRAAFAACAAWLALYELRVTVIGTGFDHGRARPRSAREETRTSRRDRDVRMDERQRSSLEIRDDDLDIPPFLR